jgi:hypothetical protein
MKRSGMKVTSNDLLALIRSEPDADKHIFQLDDGWHVTQEWLVGGFAGRSFVAATPEAAAIEQIAYLNRHVGHDSIVGRCVTDSGWPDLDHVKAWLVGQREDSNAQISGGTPSGEKEVQ